MLAKENKDLHWKLERRLDKLIHKHDIMLFMKGDRENPQCGYSQHMVDILDETQMKYNTFDILEDDDVREGLKKYSQWPTYPQLYVKGDLVGGLDIVKLLKQNGTLMKFLNPPLEPE